MVVFVENDRHRAIAGNGARATNLILDLLGPMLAIAMQQKEVGSSHNVFIGDATAPIARSHEQPSPIQPVLLHAINQFMHARWLENFAIVLFHIAFVVYLYEHVAIGV